MAEKRIQLLTVVGVLLFLVLPVLSFAGENHFYFVQITDTHLGIRENDDRTRKIVKAVNRLPMDIECVVHTGDVYDRRIRRNEKAVAKAVKVFEALKPPVIFLPGNNEINVFKKDTEQARELWSRLFGPLVGSRDVHGVRFVFAYTDPLREGLPIEGFDPFEAVLTQIQKSNGSPVLLFHHGASVRDFYENKFHDGWEKNVQAKWLDLINGHNVVAVITGHFHRDELHWLGKVPLYVSGPVAEKFGRQAGFRIYEYTNGRIGYTAQYLD